MLPTSHHLYHSILLRAADEWGIEYEDVERDIGQQFDPVVRFLAGACASELERVYQHLHDTESRLQDRLTKVLLPEYFHLPAPAHALATATTSEEELVIDETAGFELVEGEGEEKGKFAFTPVFPIRLLPVKLKVLATENLLFESGRRPSYRQGQEEGREFGRILLGFEMTEGVSNWKGATLCFDLKGGGEEDPARAKLFAALSKSRCFLDGVEIQTRPGLPKPNLLLEDYLNGNERLHSQVRARYDRQFLTFLENELQKTSPKLVGEFLPQWFASAISDPEELEKQMSRLDPGLKKPLHWLEIHFGYPVELDQVEARLSVRFNVFPVANRRLCGAGNGEHHYLQNTSIKWLHLQPEEDFVSIRSVYEEKPPEYPPFTFKPFADFKEDRNPAYTIRHGGVGRWDDFNAWKRLAYVVGVLQEQYEHNELIQKAASSLSLEDVHNLLGQKISKTAAEQKPTRDIYILLHSGITAGIRVRVEYWTSPGAAGNGIPARSSLRCTTKLAFSLDKDSIELVTSTIDGRAPLNSTEQVDAMKSALLSRGKIVTREDVKAFCREFLRDKISDLSVQDGVGTDPRYDFGMTRQLEVRLAPTQKAKKEDWEGICHQLQGLLEQRSTSTIPIRVMLETSESIR